METEHTMQDRESLLRRAVTGAEPGELRTALELATRSGFQPNKAVHNALLALQRHHDPCPYLSKTQYRPAIPYLAVALSNECLNRTVEVLGDNSDDPTEEQLSEALDAVRSEFSDTVIAAMLATVAYDDLPSSDLCARLLATDERYGLADLP